MRQFFLMFVVVCVIAVSGPVWAGEDAVTPETPERFRGRVVALSGPASGGTAYLTLHVDRWTSDEEIASLRETLVKSGPEALLSAVSNLESAGWIRIGDGLRYHLRVIDSIPTEEGRVIRALTDRPIYFEEAVNNTRSFKYAFGVVEIELDKKNKGGGQLVPAAEIRFNNGQDVEIVSLGTQPIRILSVGPQKVK